MKKNLIFSLKIAIIVCMFGWIVIVFTDYFRVRQNKEPLFCIHKVEQPYEDGTNTICTGLGYKAIKYNRDCLNASEFGPFIIKERTCD